MKQVHINYLAPVLLVSAILASGCSSMASQTDTASAASACCDEAAKQQTLIRQKNQEIASLQSRIGNLTSALSRAQKSSSASMAKASTGTSEMLPPNAKAGECYARVYIPPTFSSETQRMLSREATSRIETTPPKFAWGEERVLVKEASSRLEVIPAKYEWIEERVLVSPATTRLTTMPAVYETVSEKILDKPAHTVWKKGTGPITKVDEATGEIMCLVDVPASYRTVTKRVQIKPPTTKEVVIPAEYKTVKKRVMKAPPTTRTIEIPAQYNTVKVKKLVEPGKSKTITIPAEYTTVTKRAKTSEGGVEWRPILCKTNTTPDIVARIQTALKDAGHNPGPIDGIIGRQTLSAVRSYQQSKGLATGGLTISTLKSLKVLY